MNEWNISRAQFGKSSWNPFSSASKGIEKLGAAATAAVTASALGQQIEQSRKNQEAQNQAHMEHTERTQAADHEHELRRMTLEHVLSERSAKSGQKRLLEFHGQVTKHSEPGTAVEYKAGDTSAKFTSRKPKARPVKMTGTVAPFPSVKLAEEPQVEPATPAKSEEGPKPLVKKGPGGKFQSLKSPEEQVPTVKKSKKSAVTGPTVGRGPGGKMVSLKRN